MLWWLAYAFIGWGLASWVIVRLSLPDPPPDARTWALTSLAGFLGGGAGAYFAAIVSPEIGAPLLGALAGAAVLLGIVRTFMRTPRALR